MYYGTVFICVSVATLAGVERRMKDKIRIAELVLLPQNVHM